MESDKQLVLPERAAPEAIQPVTPMQMLQIAVQQGANIEMLSKLMDLQERFETNEARKAYQAAMARFKENPPEVNKNRHVKFGTTEYDHATLDHATTEITKALSAVGIAHRWEVKQTDKAIEVTCVLTHEMGHSERTSLAAPADTTGSKNSIQAIGSTVSYLERYTLFAATGLAAKGTDDDGQSAEQLPEFGDFMEIIRAAATLGELQGAFKEAYKKATEAKNDAAMKAFIAAKDARKKELQ